MAGGQVGIELVAGILDRDRRVQLRLSGRQVEHRCLLAEPGQAYSRGSGSSPGLFMAAVGDRLATE